MDRHYVDLGMGHVTPSALPHDDWDPWTVTDMHRICLGGLSCSDKLCHWYPLIDLPLMLDSTSI